MCIVLVFNCLRNACLRTRAYRKAITMYVGNMIWTWESLPRFSCPLGSPFNNFWEIYVPTSYVVPLMRNRRFWHNDLFDLIINIGKLTVP